MLKIIILIFIVLTLFSEGSSALFGIVFFGAIIYIGCRLLRLEDEIDHPEWFDGDDE